MPDSNTKLYIGLMSGTSLDGVDGALAEFSEDGSIATISTAYLPFPPALRGDLLLLQSPSENEIHCEALSANGLAQVYSECVSALLSKAGLSPVNVRAIGAHGQTIRHRPECGYTWQTNNPALLAELTGIDVIADFRSRDIAAGGQGAPLVPAFHQSAFGDEKEVRVVANIGGISNISVLNRGESIIGFDTGPGNVLMDNWVSKHLDQAYDADGAWASSGAEIPDLLAILMNEPYLALPPPKSTGRDLFHADWLGNKLAQHGSARPEDVQATLAAFTAESLAEGVARYAPDATSLYVCGGGAYNAHLMRRLQQALIGHRHAAKVQSTDVLGISPNHVEALAFAWLAYRHALGQAGNLPSVTGAKGTRILGALYPA